MQVSSNGNPKNDKTLSINTATSMKFGDYTYYDMLTLRPPKSRLENTVPRPRRATLPDGLPLWEKKPLNAKLPLLAGPEGPIVFTRGKLGDKLWKSPEGAEFSMSDPHGHEVRFDYEPAHDSHLRGWLRGRNILKILKNQDLLTSDLRVKCSVQQYNRFRRFLYSIYSDALRKQQQKEEVMATEKLMLHKAFESAKKDAEYIKRLEDSNAKRLSNLKKIERLDFERLEKCRKRLQRVIDRAAQAEIRKKEELIQRKQRMEAFDERIKSRVIAANRIERHNKIKAMKNWHEQDVQKKIKFEKRKQKREIENKTKAEARWRKKVEEQKKQIAKEEFLHEQRRKIMEKERQQYMKLMEKEWAKMEEQLEMRKCESRLKKIRKSQRDKNMKQIMKSVSDAYSKSMEFLSQDEDTLHILRERIQQILKEIRYDLEPYIVIAHAKSRLEKQENVPLPVSGVIKFLLEETVVEYTANHLSTTVEVTAKKVLTAIDEIKAQAIAPDRQSVSAKKSVMSEFIRKESLISTGTGRTARISTVPDFVIPVYKNVDELAVSVDELRSVKKRPPTPMPSITTLTEVLFNDPEGKEFEDASPKAFALIEQRKLLQAIAKVSNTIYRMIPSRVRTVVESRSYDRISASDGGSTDSLPESKPIAKLCSILLFEDPEYEKDLTHIIDRIILGFMQDIDLPPFALRLHIKQKQEKIQA